MEDIETPVCTHDNTPMKRVWADGRGNALYQCPTCGRKTDVKANGNRR